MEHRNGYLAIACHGTSLKFWLPPSFLPSSQTSVPTTMPSPRIALLLGLDEIAVAEEGAVEIEDVRPVFAQGLRLGIGVAWTAVIVAEMIAVKSGLGYVLWDAYYVGRMDICVATMFSVGLLGFISDRIIVWSGHLVLRWRMLEAHA